MGRTEPSASQAVTVLFIWLASLAWQFNVLYTLPAWEKLPNFVHGQANQPHSQAAAYPKSVYTNGNNYKEGEKRR